MLKDKGELKDPYKTTTQTSQNPEETFTQNNQRKPHPQQLDESINVIQLRIQPKVRLRNCDK